MIPGSYDIKTCKEVIGDARCRIIEKDARDKAALEINEPSEGIFSSGIGTYWCKVQERMQYIIWNEAYIKRLNRIRRTIPQNPSTVHGLAC